VLWRDLVQKKNYKAMASATCELIFLKQLLKELQFGKVTQMTLIYDNQVSFHISSNPIFYERTKHLEIDCHFIRENIVSGDTRLSLLIK